MKPITLFAIAGGLLTLAAGWWIGLGSELGPVIVMTLGFVAIITATANRLSLDVDREWLAKIVTLGYLVKIMGAGLRYYFTAYIYNSGDAIAYHAAGVQLAGIWRQLEVPEVVGRSMGTRFIENVTGLVYTPHIPHILGGFIIFATAAFVGQLFFYAAFRRSFPNGRLRTYALLIFLLPALSFWPSSIGKDAVIVLFLGIGAYAAVRLFERYQLRWLVVLGVGAWGAGVVRAHIAALFLVAVAVVALLAKGPGTLVANTRRLALIGVLALGALLAAQQVADAFRFDLESVDIDPVVSDIERRTGQGGSELGGGAVEGVTDFPGAFVRVLFSPLPHQAHNAQALFAALETTFLLGLFIKESPWIGKALIRIRRNAYWMLSLLYTLGFVIGFSAVLNAGILARQRSQVIAIFLVVVIGARTLVEQLEEDGQKRYRNDPDSPVGVSRPTDSTARQPASARLR